MDESRLNLKKLGETLNLFSPSAPQSMNDQPSLQELGNLHQEMLRRRAATGIYTIDPGVTWGGRDRMIYAPDESSYRAYSDI